MGALLTTLGFSPDSLREWSHTQAAREECRGQQPSAPSSSQQVASRPSFFWRWQLFPARQAQRCPTLCAASHLPARSGGMISHLLPLTAPRQADL